MLLLHTLGVLGQGSPVDGLSWLVSVPVPLCGVSMECPCLSLSSADSFPRCAAPVCPNKPELIPAGAGTAWAGLTRVTAPASCATGQLYF